jgi:hypothetical protein
MPDCCPSVSRESSITNLHGVSVMNSTNLSRRCAVELVGTSWLVFGSCGSVLLAASVPAAGIGLLGVSLAFGLTV